MQTELNKSELCLCTLQGCKEICVNLCDGSECACLCK